MPGNARSLDLTDAWRTRQIRLTDATIRAVAAGWRNVRRDDLEPSFRGWLAGAVQTVTFAQREAVRLADAYLAAYLSSELSEAVTPQGLDADAYAGRSRRGNELRNSFAPVLIAVLTALKQRRPDEQAMFAGLARAVKATRSEVMQASRFALRDLMAADARVTGSRRVTRGTCGACMALAGERIGKGHMLASHPNCHCLTEPIVRGVRETVQRPTGDELWAAMSRAAQNEMFRGRGGEAKADLIRGGLALAALVARSVGPDGNTQITEAPLDEVEDEL